MSKSFIVEAYVIRNGDAIPLNNEEISERYANFLDLSVRRSMSQLSSKRRGVISASGSTSSGTSSGSGATAAGNPAPTNMSTDLASLFECPVCFDYVLPPILQCQSGHLVCSNCRPKLTCCPTCRGQLGR